MNKTFRKMECNFSVLSLCTIYPKIYTTNSSDSYLWMQLCFLFDFFNFDYFVCMSNESK